MESPLSPDNLDKLASIAPGISGDFSLQDATGRISGSLGKQGQLEAVLSMYAYLSHSENVTMDHEQSSKLAKLLGESLVLPDSAKPGEMSFALASEAGVACLQLLSSQWSCNMDDSLLLRVVAFTDAEDPWTTRQASRVALNLLCEQLTADRQTEFVVGPVLQSFLKPLFAKSSARITESGRPDRYQGTGDAPRQQPSLVTPSWKSKAPWAPTTLKWAVQVSNASLVQSNWPLFTPVLLALVEDESIETKMKGLESLSLFIAKCPSSVLHTTGIGRVFEDATFPLLLYLPSLTPEHESAQLLSRASLALIQLAESYNPPDHAERRRLLDKLLREGISAAFSHASQYAHLVQILMVSLKSIVNCLGIYTVKHLKNILSVISSIIEDPFATASPPTLLAAIEALQAVITNCWVRLQQGHHFEQIIRSLSISWLNLCENQDVPAADDDSQRISRALNATASLLQAIWRCPEPPEEWDKVLDMDPRLIKLFPKFSA